MFSSPSGSISWSACRPPRPRLHRLLCRRGLSLRPPRQSPLRAAPAFLGHPAPGRDRRLRLRRRPGAPTLKLRGDYLAIVTLGFGEIIRIFLNNLNAPVNITNGAQGITLIDPLALGASASAAIAKSSVWWSAARKLYFLLVAMALVVIGVNLRLQDSRIGRAWQAIREDGWPPKAIGIDTRNIKLLAFAMGASFGGIAGGISPPCRVSSRRRAFPHRGRSWCWPWWSSGHGHIPGDPGRRPADRPAEVLRYAVGPVQQAVFGKVIVDPESLRMLIFGLGLVLVMRLKPAGLWPSPQRRRELAAGAQMESP